MVFSKCICQSRHISLVQRDISQFCPVVKIFGSQSHYCLASQVSFTDTNCRHYIGWHNKTGTFEKPNKNWRNSRKKNIDRNWTITTCRLRDSNPNYQCVKITSCRWRPPSQSFTATTHFKSSRSFVSPCVCCMLCRMRQSQSLSLQDKVNTRVTTTVVEIIEIIITRL